LLAAIPVSLTQAAVDAAIATSERRIIEQLARDMGDKFRQLQVQIAELKALPTPVTRNDVENLIRDAMQIIKPIEPNNSELETLGRVVNDRITKLENRLNDFSQSIGSCVTRPTVDDLIRHAISNSQPTTSQTLVTPQPDIGLQKRIALIEQRLDTFPLVEDLHQIKQRLTQLENRADDHIRNVPLVGVAPSLPLAESITKNTVYVEDSRIIPLQNQVNGHASSLQDLHKEINELKRTRIDHPGVHQLVNASEEKARQPVNDLTKYVHHECQDARLPGVISELSNYSTIIQNLNNQINSLDRDKPDLKTVERLIRDSEERIVGAASPVVSVAGQPDPRIPGLQTQINGHSGLIQSLEKQLEQFRQTKPDQQVVQQLIDESERRTKAAIDNLPLPVHEGCQDSRLSDVLQQIHDHTTSIQDLNNRINQLPNIQSNDELRTKIDDNEREVKRAHRDLDALRRQLAQQPISTFQSSLPQPPLPPPAEKDSPARQYTDEELQTIMPFIELLPTFNLFVENEWD
jgi:DNA repair exonuclease SbcCD ATPase subunit